MTPARGKVIASKYRLIRPLASGGMGSLWVAHHLDLEVDVAVKFMIEELAGNEVVRNRFRREARAAALLKGPNITHIYDFGVDDGAPYIAMELLEGEDLESLIARKKWIGLEAVADIVRQICRGLAVAHQAGIVHRDLKPSNVFLTRSGGERLVKILDFGIAKQLTPDLSTGAGTASGVLVGSPRYMSPEQSLGETIDYRSDLWSVAVVTYELLTGHNPFEADSLGQIMTRICSQPAAPPSSVMNSLPPGVDAFMARGLSIDPGQRFQSAQELAAAFTAVARGEPLPPPAPVPIELADTAKEEHGEMRKTIDGVLEQLPEVMGRLDETAEIPMPLDKTQELPPEAPHEVVTVASSEPPPPRRSRAGLWVVLLLLATLAGAWALLSDGDPADASSGAVP